MNFTASASLSVRLSLRCSLIVFFLGVNLASQTIVTTPVTAGQKVIGQSSMDSLVGKLKNTLNEPEVVKMAEDGKKAIETGFSKSSKIRTTPSFRDRNPKRKTTGATTSERTKQVEGTPLEESTGDVYVGGEVSVVLQSSFDDASSHQQSPPDEKLFFEAALAEPLLHEGLHATQTFRHPKDTEKKLAEYNLTELDALYSYYRCEMQAYWLSWCLWFSVYENMQDAGWRKKAEDKKFKASCERAKYMAKCLEIIAEEERRKQSR